MREKEEFRLEALKLASLDAKHQGSYGGGMMQHTMPGGPPDAAQVVARAKLYLAFVEDDRSAIKRRKRS